MHANQDIMHKIQIFSVECPVMFVLLVRLNPRSRSWIKNFKLSLYSYLSPLAFHSYEYLFAKHNIMDYQDAYFKRKEKYMNSALILTRTQTWGFVL